MTRRESIRLGALLALLIGVGIAGGSPSAELRAQERAMAAADASGTFVSAGPGVVVAAGALQLVGVIMLEAMAFGRRRAAARLTRLRPAPAPSPYRFRAPAPTSRTHRAA